MAFLILKLRGEEVSRIELESGREYIAGRGQESAIPLANERGISRQHLKFFERDGVWICESLSKFVLIQKGSESLEYVELTEACSFNVPPYEFHFEPKAVKAAESKSLPALRNPEPQSSPDADTSAKLYGEGTVAGQGNLIPYLRIQHGNTTDEEVIKLEGQLWVGGRDPACEIAIESQHISRRHFELARTPEGYFITDLGSSNGTRINGNKIHPHEPTRLNSGDELSIKSITIVFEIRDSQFMSRMDNLPVAAFEPVLEEIPAPYSQNSLMVSEATVYRTYQEPSPYQSEKKKKRFDWKENKLRAALMVMVPVLLIAALMKQEPSAKRDPNSDKQIKSPVFENLSIEQKAVVKDSFNLARNLYVQGKYELCLTELAKVHELLPQYENSKELQSFCEQGRELVLRQIDLERRNKEKQEIENQISSHVENCRAKLNDTATVDETRECLAQAIELAPEHPSVMEMIHKAQSTEDERRLLAQQRAEVNGRVQRGRAHYERVKAVWKNGKLAKAIVEYERFLQSSYPRIDKEKALARRELASIKAELKTKVDTMLEECKQKASRNQFKEAYLACDKAVDEDPDHADAKETRRRMHAELSREMKSIYEDSVLEESLGNVDSAKEKWKKIIKENLDFDDYTLKAKSKLKRYGIGT